MLEPIKFVIERFDRLEKSDERKKYLEILIATEAQENLDLITILRLKGIKEKPDEKRKVISCFKTVASEALQTIGIAPTEILEGGDYPQIVESLNEGPRDKNGVLLNSLEDFRKQSTLWLFLYSSRKIRTLKELSEKNFDYETLLNLERRLKNVSLALRVIVERLNVTKAVNMN